MIQLRITDSPVPDHGKSSVARTICNFGVRLTMSESREEKELISGIKNITGNLGSALNFRDLKLPQKTEFSIVLAVGGYSLTDRNCKFPQKGKNRCQTFHFW